MADGSSGNRTDLKQINDLSFSGPEIGLGDTKKCSDDSLQDDKVKLSFYTELKQSESCEKSVSSGVAVYRSAVDSTDSRKLCEPPCDDGEDLKKRCVDRYDSSESSDSGVEVLSPSDSGTCSSDSTEPRSPGSPESGCSTGSEGRSPHRMPPWASEPAPAPPPPPPPAPAPRRLPQLAPTRRSEQSHRRITEYFNHKMKPQNGVKRDSTPLVHDDTKRKCLPKNGVTHDLQKYISYLSQTLSPKVLMDVGKQVEAATRKSTTPCANLTPGGTADLSKNVPSANTNGMVDLSRPKDNNDKVHTTMNGFVELRPYDSAIKDTSFNGLTNSKKQSFNHKLKNEPPANGMMNMIKQTQDLTNTKVPIPGKSDLQGMKMSLSNERNTSSKNGILSKTELTKVNSVVSSSTVKLDNKMNGVTCGSNNLSLHSITCKPIQNKMSPKKNTSTVKRTNRKSSACIANSKNLTWSKANNLKQVQLQKQNCANAAQATPVNNLSVNGEANTAQPKMNNIPNGVRQVSMTVNGLNNLNVPVTNFQNCHQLNIPQPCNGTVTSNNLPSFVAVPQNVMLTTLRIPQNGLPGQTLNTQNNMNAYTRPNCNVSSPTKLNGQFMFPLVQNINGTVVQIPNLMAKMPNFVLPQTSQLTPQRQDHLQNQQAAQFLINGTLLKLANTMTSSYPNVNSNGKQTPTSQSIPVMNKNVTGIPAVGMVQSKSNYTVNLSHPMLMSQSGFIVTSVPNMNVKETWSYTSTNTASSSQTSCSNPIVHHPPPLLASYQAQTLHTSSIPIAPVKPPDNPIQGTDPPSSTVKEPEIADIANQKCDIPWLSKTVNNNIVPYDSKLPTRPFANVSSLTENFEDFKSKSKDRTEIKGEEILKESTPEEIRKVEEVARREETIFTQITVLKDVSSNVQSSMIEANFCSATTESSESGIGTDKSIASPSDSQASKECDDDSSLSLSVSVCSVDVDVQSCQKSPILKQPKTLRFPPRNLEKDSDRRTSSTDTTNTVTVCLWENCKQEFENDTDLLEHLQSIHVESQAGKENYVCLWQQCKVRGKPSCSRLWLERHALSHGGNKPFKCIVDGCDRRFSTQLILERHVNNHFNDSASNASGSKKSTDSATKLIRRNGKKLRYRRQPWSARMFDFFDAGMMEGLAWRLGRVTRWRLGGACPLRESPTGHHLSFTACLAATRYNPATATKEALLTYYPPHVIEDEWVPEKDVKRIKHVEISQLPAHSKVLLYEQFCASYRKTPSPTPVKKTPPTPQPSRLLPARHCTSSRVLNNLLAKQRKERSNCSATNVPMMYVEEETKVEVSGAKKRKMGRRHGGNAFWPCGR